MSRNVVFTALAGLSAEGSDGDAEGSGAGAEGTHGAGDTEGGGACGADGGAWWWGCNACRCARGAPVCTRLWCGVPDCLAPGAAPCRTDEVRTCVPHC